MSNLVEQVDQMHQVARLYMKGHDAGSISKQLSIRRIDAKRLIDEWHVWLRQLAKSNADIRDRVTDILFEVDQHYAMVIKETWDTVRQADEEGQLSNKTQALKLVASINKDRIGMFQQAGLNQDNELAAELEETQHQQEAIKAILKEVSGKCSNCKLEVAHRLAELNDQAEVIDVERSELESST